MQIQKGQIVNKNVIIRQDEFSREEYEGLIAASDTENGIYNIALQLSENTVLIVDQVKDSEVHERYHEIAAHRQDIKKQHNNRESLKYI